ncbi:MAG: heme-binding protein [Burkholderiales bacterium]
MSVKATLITLSAAAVLALGAASASAQERPSYGPDVDLAAAKKMAAAAVAEAKKHNWNVAVAVVDNHGFLVYFEKLDQTQTASVQVAIDKARSAALYRRPTRAFEDAVTKGRVAVMNLTGVSVITGGLPIMKDGRVIGGIGASGVLADQDEQVSKAGLAGM